MSKSAGWLRVVLGLSAMVFSGCAPMGVGPPVVTDVPKSREQRAISNGTRDAEIVQDGVRTSVQLADHCYVQQVDKIERTTIREHQNLAPGNDWWAGIGGAALSGAGAVAIARPSAMQPKDGSSSVEEVRGTGYAMVGVGVLLLAVPVIDYLRAHREAEHKVELVEEHGPVVQQDIRCGVPAAGTEVSGRYPDGRGVVFGRTNARGVVEARLDEVTPAGCRFAKDDRVALFVGDARLGDISLAALYVQWEGDAWRLAAANECTTSLDENACEAQLAYTQRFPTGEHAEEARRQIDEASTRRLIAADEAAWSRVDPRPCHAPAKHDLEAIAAACAPLEGYLIRYPNGRHADAAREVLRPALAVRARLEEAKESRERADQLVASTGAFIPYEGNGGGPTLCADGSLSHSSGRGTCSHHGGVAGGGHHRSGGGHRRSSGGHSRRK